VSRHRLRTRRKFLQEAGAAVSSASLALLSGFGLTGCARRSGRRPNVVLVLTDDQGYGDLGCHGNPDIRTPRLDGFHAESVRFTNFYACPLCSPTRASLLTGRYNYRTGVVDTWIGLSLMRPEELTAAELLRAAGYRTGIFGKWHLGDHFPLRPQEQGFEECLVHKGAGMGGRSNPPGNLYYDPVLYHNKEVKTYRGYCTDIFFRAAEEYIEAHATEPLFVYLPTNVPHVPLEIAAEEVTPYTDLGLDETTARHYAMLSNLDANFGRLLDTIERLGLTRDTIVIFMSDNGPAYGNRFNAGLRDMKGSVYDGGIKVPFFLRWPGRVAGGVDVDRIGAHIDVLPTILELCGVPRPRNTDLDGASLAPLLVGTAPDWPDRTLFFQQCRPDQNGIDTPRPFTHCAARSQRFKIVMSARPSAARFSRAVPFEETELYDMAADPGERLDLASQNPVIVERMRAEYERWFRDVTAGLAPVRIHLGSPLHNPLVLNNQDLSGPGAAVSYSSYSRLARNPEEEPDGSGVWNVHVARTGRYRIALRFGQVSKETWIPLRKGRAIFKLGMAEVAFDVAEGQREAGFVIILTRGDGSLETYFTGQRADGRPVTPFFVEVEYLGPEAASPIDQGGK
jgi:arylsulfatase A-like enzyme